MCSVYEPGATVSRSRASAIPSEPVTAVALMPPTLVGTIYGMNFKNMPELEWTLGYPMALILMVISAVLPFFIFKWKKWL